MSASRLPASRSWLGADAILDVAGVALTDPFSTPERGLLALPTTGKVLNGGSVALSDDSGTVIVQAGAVIDVSGTAAIFDEAQAGAGRLASVNDTPQPVWSNAGSITLAAFGGLYFDGTLEAQAGGAAGRRRHADHSARGQHQHFGNHQRHIGELSRRQRHDGPAQWNEGHHAGSDGGRLRAERQLRSGGTDAGPGFPR